MLVRKLGEFALIDRIKKKIKLDKTVIRGSGDDCAVLKLDKDRYQLFSSDMIVEDVDFTVKTDPRLVGRKALGISLSDIAACGGIPRHCVVSLALPKNVTVEYADKLVSGLIALADEFKVNIVGGDISRADKVVIDTAVIGEVEKVNLVLRNDARVGDKILVSGSFGGSIRGKHLKFTPRVKEARYLVENFKINAMIDVTDGLLQDLSHILDSSHQQAKVYSHMIPLSKDACGIEEAFYMGEDFELLFAASAIQTKKILSQNEFKFTLIGEIVEGNNKITILDRDNRVVPVKKKGFSHF